ncbi:hypothetical protein GUJ93_ZPchr0002g23869 [Zizania palustris]|uniref:Uncharacterized protein n=1 Tax=Zizania palustris TaxID=103762 RepID=A0A8J5VR40_ZIZPA|nr:hypothetical protein GUJ93_ZPchr0002g23869 [Zizania palustris]
MAACSRPSKSESYICCSRTHTSSSSSPRASTRAPLSFRSPRRPPLDYCLCQCMCMDRRRQPERKATKRSREEEEVVVVAATSGALDFFPFEEEAAGDDVGDQEWRRPPGVFRFPWQKCRGGLGVAGGGWELRDVFFRSLVDGGAAAIGVPGDRLVSPPPPSKQRALFDDVDAWLSAAADGEVDPVWRSALKGGEPAPAA